MTMRALVRWIIWRLSSDGKKLPHDPRNPDGSPIDSTDERYWVSAANGNSITKAHPSPGYKS
jgi:hypothetical protein